jgi:hypothetical protein
MNACPARADGGSSPVVAIFRHSITVWWVAGQEERAGRRERREEREER